ncbi:MAG TPA: replication endonuclease [Zeimonas sp.]
MRPRKPLPLARLPEELREAVRRRYWGMLGVRYDPDTGIDGADLRRASFETIERGNAFWKRADALGDAVTVGAPDSEIVEWADRRADECARIAEHRLDAAELRRLMARVAEGYGLDAPGEEVRDGPAIARMLDAGWWRRALRRVNAREYEGLAIGAGLVHVKAGLYCSDAALRRRIGQNARNAETLERVEVENDAGHRFTLAQLAAKGTANKAIRRGELMVRIAGFEEIARVDGHAAEFVTMTCPSRMHARTRDNAAPNKAYDGTSPREAQRHLSRTWARIRAALARHGVKLYGVRIAEPHHDGCPHWHMLVFLPGEARELVRETIARYALAVDGDEPGAREYRVKFEAIDPAKGSAAGYVAKYVAKNIDGMHVGDDLFGMPAIESSARVEAWAATWGIRQFQQVGGPPVGLWRELRRIQPATVAAAQSDALRSAWECAQRRDTTKAPAAESALRVRPGAEHPADFAGFVRAWGGPTIKRAAGALRLWKLWRDEPGRYGEPLGLAPIGVEAKYRGRDGLVMRDLWERVESLRYVWRVVRAALSKRAQQLAEAVARMVRVASRTRVNNCTADPGPEPAGEGADLWTTRAGPPRAAPVEG